MQEKRSVFCHPLHSCTNCKDPSNTQNILLISDERNILPLKGIHPPPLPWQNWFGVALTLDHKKCIENGNWLCDYIIHASQMLLKNTYPNVGGLQNPLLAEKFQHGAMSERIYPNFEFEQQSLDNSVNYRMFNIKYKCI